MRRGIDLVNGRGFEEAAGAAGLVQQGLDAGAQCGIAAAVPVEDGDSGGGFGLLESPHKNVPLRHGRTG